MTAIDTAINEQRSMTSISKQTAAIDKQESPSHCITAFLTMRGMRPYGWLTVTGRETTIHLRWRREGTDAAIEFFNAVSLFFGAKSIRDLILTGASRNRAI
eukprot:scaffold11429_cov48-Cyclotella_meneghiniana.AAC.6